MVGICKMEDTQTSLDCVLNFYLPRFGCTGQSGQQHLLLISIYDVEQMTNQIAMEQAEEAKPVLWVRNLEIASNCVSKRLVLT